MSFKNIGDVFRSIFFSVTAKSDGCFSSLAVQIAETGLLLI